MGPENREIIFSDEEHFAIGGYINKHKCFIWGDKIYVSLIKNLNKSLFSVHCGQWCNWSFFFENAGEAVTVNGIRYSQMITEFFFD